MATDEQRNAQVVISADTTQYVQGVQAAADETSKLQTAVDKLGSSLDGLASKVGKRLVFGGAGTIAAMTAAAKVAANYDQQLNTLRASAVYTGTNIDKLDKAITKTAKSFPVARSEVVALVNAFNDLGVKGASNLDRMSAASVKLGGATGENIAAVSVSLAELNRTMGTLNPTQFEKFASSLSMVANESGTSATQVASFAQSLAPFAKVAGITQTQVLGLAAAFTKAGADGFAAASTFNTMVSDIVRLSSTNSPMLAKYANLVGLTTSQFKELGTTEGITRIFEQIGSAGPDAVRILDMLGYDGIRAARSIQQVANQAGGIRSAVASATEGYSDDTKFNKSYEQAFQGWNVELDQTKELLAEITRNLGQTFLPIVTAVTKGFNAILDVVQRVTDIFDNKVFAAITGVLTSGAVGGTIGIGAALMSLSALSKIVTAAFIGNSGPVRSLFAGFRGGQAISAGLEPDDIARNNAGANNWWNRPFYGAGQAVGGAFPMGGGPGWSPSKVFALPFRAATWYANSIGTMAQDAAKLNPVDRQSALLGPLGLWGAGVGRSVRDAFDPAKASRLLDDTLERFGMGGQGTLFDDERPDGPGAQRQPTRGERNRARWEYFKTAWGRGDDSDDFRAAKQRVIDQYRNKYEPAISRLTDATEQQAARMAAATRAVQDVGAAAPKTAQAMGQLAAAAAIAAGRTEQTGLTWIGRGAGAGMRGLNNASMSLLGMSAPWAAAIGSVALGGYAVYDSKQAINAEADPDRMYGARAYSYKLGLAPSEYQTAPDALRILKSSTKPGELPSIAGAQRVTAADIDFVKANTEYTQSLIKEIDTVEGAISYMSTLGELKPEEAQLYKLDLLRKFNPEEVTQILSGLSASGKTNTYDPNALLKEAASAQSEREIFWKLGAEGDTMTQSAYGGINAESAKYKRFGPQAENLSRASSTRDYISSLFQLNTGDAAERQIFERGIKLLEQDYGDLNFAVGGATGAGGRYTGLNKEQQLALFMKETGTDPGGVKLNELLGADYGSSAKGRLDNLVAQGGSIDSFNTRIRNSGVAGAIAIDSKTIAEATTSKIADPKAQAAAVTELTNRTMAASSSIGETVTSLRAMKDAAESTEDPLYKIADAAEQLAIRISSIRLQGSASQADIRSEKNREWAARSANGSADAPAVYEEMLSAEASDREKLIGMVRSMRSMELQRSRSYEDFNISRDRAEKQYNLQRERAEYDYNRGRLWAEEDFQRQRSQTIADYQKQRGRSEYDYQLSQKRSIEDYNRGVLRAEADFNLSRARAQRDFNKSMARMAEDAAASMYAPYQRVTTQMTWDTENLLANLQDQTKRMQEQSANLEKLRNMGVSQEAIDQLGLADAANAQQTARLTQDLESDKSLVGDVNNEAAARAKAAKDLATDESNKEYRRSIEDFKQSMRDSEDDFKKQQARNEADFKRSLARSNTDFQRALARQDKDFNTALARSDSAYARGLKRQETQFNESLKRQREDWNTSRSQQLADFRKTMSRQQEDAKNAYEEIYGTVDELADEAMRLLTRNLGSYGTKIKSEMKSWLEQAQRTRVQIALMEVNDYNRNKQANERIGLTIGRDGRYLIRYPNGYSGPRYDDVLGQPGAYQLPQMHAGGIRTKRQLVEFAEHGPEAAIPLNKAGINFMVQTMRQLGAQEIIAPRWGESREFATKVVYKGDTTYNYDYSVDVSGPITIKAENPSDLAQHMRETARRARLTRNG